MACYTFYDSYVICKLRLAYILELKMHTDHVKEYSLGEEIANSISHGIGASLGIAALAILVTIAAKAGDAWRVVSFSVYGTTLVFLFLASTFYHSFPWPRVKMIFKLLDHIAIYLLIAGTYTPFTLVNLRGAWGWSLFGVIWGLAILGVLKTVLIKKRLKVFSLALYISMGWLIVIAAKPLLALLPVGGLIWLGVGGLAYTIGVVFYLWKRLPYNHAIWHVFVLGGSICHFFGVLFYVGPMS